jgi:hypothetical protein
MHPHDANQAAFLHELKALQTEALGWLPLAQGAYLHRGAPADSPQDFAVVEVVGLADVSMAGLNVLWLV